MSRSEKQAKNESHKQSMDTIFKNPKQISERPGLQQIDVPAAQNKCQVDPQPLMSLQVPKHNHQPNRTFPSSEIPVSLLDLNIPRPSALTKNQKMFTGRNAQLLPRPKYPPKVIPTNQPKHTNATPKKSADLTSEHGLKIQPCQLNRSPNPGNKSMSSHVGSSTMVKKATDPIKDNSAYTEHLKKLKRRSTSCENTKAKLLKLEPDVSVQSSLESIKFTQTKLNTTQSDKEDIGNDPTSTKDIVVDVKSLPGTPSRVDIKEEYVAELHDQNDQNPISARTEHLKKLKDGGGISMKQCKKIHQPNIVSESVKIQGKEPSLKLSSQSSPQIISQNINKMVSSTATFANMTSEAQPKASDSTMSSENPYEKCLKSVAEQNDNAADQRSPTLLSSPYMSHLKKLKTPGKKPMKEGVGGKSVASTKEGDTDLEGLDASLSNKKKSSLADVFADKSGSLCNNMKSAGEKSTNVTKGVGKTPQSKPTSKEGRGGNSNITKVNKLTKVVSSVNTSETSGKLSVANSSTAGRAKERPLLDEDTLNQNSDYFKNQSEAYAAHLKKLKKASQKPVSRSNKGVDKKTCGSEVPKTMMSNRQSTNESVSQSKNSQLNISDSPKAVTHSTISPSSKSSDSMKNLSKPSEEGARKSKNTRAHTVVSSNENTGRKSHSVVSQTESTNRQNVNKLAPNSKKATLHAKASLPYDGANNSGCDASKRNNKSYEVDSKQASQKQEKPNTNASRNITRSRQHVKSGPQSKTLPQKLGSNAERSTTKGCSAKVDSSNQPTVSDIPSLLSLTLERPTSVASLDHIAPRRVSKHIASMKDSLLSNETTNRLAQSTLQPIAVPSVSRQTISQTSPSISSVQRSVVSCRIPSILSISPDQASTQKSTTMVPGPSVDFISLSDSPSALDGLYRSPKTARNNNNLITCVTNADYDFNDNKTSRDPVSQPATGPFRNKPRHTVMDKIREIRKDKEESDRCNKSDGKLVKARVPVEHSSAGHYPLHQQDEYITIDTTCGENDTPSKNYQVGTTGKKVAVASDFFSDPDEPACEKEPPKPAVKGILKRQSYGEGQPANSKRHCKDEPASKLTTSPKIRPKLQFESDTIIAVPSIKKDGADALANMSIDSAIAAGVQFLRPVSGYNCVLCRTFYCDYPTALHHCTLLGHKMKVLKELSSKKNAEGDTPP